MEIISKRDGVGPGEREIRRLIGENRGTINRLADHLTQGAWSARNAARPAPTVEPESRQFGYTPASGEAEIEPRVRISPNDRVVLMNAATSRQIAFLGLIRGPRRERRFVLATKDNGFIEPLAQDLVERLRTLDGRLLVGASAEEDLARTIAANLGLPIS